METKNLDKKIDKLPIKIDFDFSGCDEIEMNFHTFTPEFVYDLCKAHYTNNKIQLDIGGCEWHFLVINIIMNADVGELSVRLTPIIYQN